MGWGGLQKPLLGTASSARAPASPTDSRNQAELWPAQCQRLAWDAGGDGTLSGPLLPCCTKPHVSSDGKHLKSQLPVSNSRHLQYCPQLTGAA